MMQFSKKVGKATVMFGLIFMLAAPVMAGSGYGPGDGTGTGDGPQDGTGNGPGDCTTKTFSLQESALLLAGNGHGGGNQGSGDNGGYGPGDGTGDGEGPEDGTGYGPGTGDCVNS